MTKLYAESLPAIVIAVMPKIVVISINSIGIYTPTELNPFELHILNNFVENIVCDVVDAKSYSF